MNLDLHYRMIDLNKLQLTGNKVIDEEHINLLNNINKIYNVIEKEDCKDSISAKLSDMILFARQHFKHEEDIMDALNYPYATKHKGEHKKILNNMQLAIMQCREENSTKYLKSVLKKNIEEWVLDHIHDLDIPLLKLKSEQSSK